MTTKLVWRLANKPTVDEIEKLMSLNLITPKEAKEILFKEEEQPKKATPSEIDDIVNELKLLRELVLANSNKTITYPIIVKQEHTYTKQPWFSTYYTYYSSDNNITY